MIIFTSFSVTSTDVAMATNFVKKMAHSHFRQSDQVTLVHCHQLISLVSMLMTLISFSRSTVTLT